MRGGDPTARTTGVDTAGGLTDDLTPQEFHVCDRRKLNVSDGSRCEKSTRTQRRNRTDDTSILWVARVLRRDSMEDRYDTIRYDTTDTID